MNQKIDCTQAAPAASVFAPGKPVTDERIQQMAQQGICGNLRAAHGVSEIGAGYYGIELFAVLLGAHFISEGGFKTRLASIVVVTAIVIHGIYLMFHGFGEVANSQIL